MRLTIDSILALGPCRDYTDDDAACLHGLFGGRNYVLHATALRDERAPVEDRVWLGIGLLPPREQRLFACDCAERALMRERDAGRKPDQRSLDAVAVSRRYADGLATDKELTTSRAAAGAAVWAAVWAAAGATSRAAAGAAERQWQIGRLIQMIDEVV